MISDFRITVQAYLEKISAQTSKNLKFKIMMINWSISKKKMNFT